MEPSFQSLAKRFSPRLNLVLINAAQLATGQGKKAIEPTHLLYSVASQQEFLIAQFFPSKEAKASAAAKKEEATDGKKKTTRKSKRDDSVILNAASQKILQYAMKLANHYHHTSIDTLHLFASLLHYPPADLKKSLVKKEMKPEELEGQILGWLEELPILSNLMDTLVPSSHEEEKHTAPSSRAPKQSALQSFAEHLTDPAYTTRLDPLIGRETELERLTRVLARRTKNNPILLGEPGVGKTAIVEGLAKKILLGDVPETLLDKKIYSLNMTAMIAGSTFRGELEARFKNLVDEISARTDVILFIDEIHTIVGAGSSPGSLDVGNILKPALARGALHCIGATTYTEYKKYIEDDPALERRFQSILVEAPTPAETEKILAGIAPYYERYHNVLITPEAISTAVSMSHRYLPEKTFPDKAIDLIDEAAAKVRIDNPLVTTKTTVTIETDSATPPPDLKARIRILDKTTIAQIIASSTGIPLENLLVSTTSSIHGLEATLDEKLVGQDAAKKVVTRYIRRSKSGLTSPQRPLASFAFVGPSGVGKTELAKILADELFGKDGFIKLDMSEFSESFTISRLIGAPSGYVGFKEGGKLTEAIRRHPHSLVLFDEIEKAHPKVANILLQILEDGYLTDAAGKKIDFSQSMIVLTSNLGAKYAQRTTDLGFSATSSYNEEEARGLFIKELENYFNPELINRLDQVVVFHPLTSEQLGSIIAKKLQSVRERLEARNVQFITTAPALAHLAKLAGDEPTQGARKVRQVVEHYAEGLIADTLLASDTPPKALILDCKKDALVCTIRSARSAKM